MCARARLQQQVGPETATPNSAAGAILVTAATLRSPLPTSTSWPKTRNPEPRCRCHLGDNCYFAHGVHDLRLAAMIRWAG